MNYEQRENFVEAIYQWVHKHISPANNQKVLELCYYIRKILPKDAATPPVAGSEYPHTKALKHIVSYIEKNNLWLPTHKFVKNIANAALAAAVPEERGHSTNPNVQEKRREPPIVAPDWIDKHNRSI